MGMACADSMVTPTAAASVEARCGYLWGSALPHGRFARWRLAMTGFASPLSNTIFETYGCSSTPTLALIDKQASCAGITSGTATESELARRLRRYCEETLSCSAIATVGALGTGCRD